MSRILTLIKECYKSSKITFERQILILMDSKHGKRDAYDMKY